MLKYNSIIYYDRKIACQQITGSLHVCPTSKCINIIYEHKVRIALYVEECFKERQGGVG